MSVSVDTTTPKPNLDVRAQILANAMVIFPQIDQSHIEACGNALPGPQKIFDIAYCTDDPAPRDQPGTLVQQGEEADGGMR